MRIHGRHVMAAALTAAMFLMTAAPACAQEAAPAATPAEAAEPAPAADTTPAAPAAETPKPVPFQPVMTVSEGERPALPLLRIQTADGTIPTCTILPAPEEGLAGQSITDNDYVAGTMQVSGAGVQGGTYEMKFKVRGNTSAAREKKPYKIKLSAAADLLGRGGGHEDTEWVLLNGGTDIKTWLGLQVSKKCSMAWTPEMRFVNLEINGDWRGLYILTESVKKSPARVNIANGGYLFENDGYWWKEGDAYFKTDGQVKFLGYTFKYPDVKGQVDRKLLALKATMQTIENRIKGGGNVWQLADRDSWARWILARDMLGQDDPVGSNMYFYKNNAKDLVRMGPLWDFDSALRIKDGWSSQHVVEYLPYQRLFADPAFVQTYSGIWSGMVATLESDLQAGMNALAAEQGAAIDRSRELDRRRWGGNPRSLEDEIREDKAWFHEHFVWMNTQIGGMVGGSDAS